MSRLQEYIKTPNPVQPEFFMIQNDPQDHGNDFLCENQPPLIRTLDQSSLAVFPKSPFGLLSLKKSPYPKPNSQHDQKIIQQRLQFGDISEQVQTPIVNKQQDNHIHTTANKKYDLRVAGAIMQSSIDHKEGERTLRVLTAQAYDVVCRKGPVTYKLVSEQIINSNYDIVNNKQKNNIKRRVYDALNVLMALGKLEKKGRKILPSKQFEVDKAGKQKIWQLRKNLQEKQAVVNSKRRLKTKLQRRNLILKKLFSRNKNNFEKNSCSEIINMPFIISSTKEFKQLSNQDERNSKIVLKLNKNINIYGDLEAIDYLKMSSK